jgi:hypothetical protein
VICGGGTNVGELVVFGVVPCIVVEVVAPVVVEVGFEVVVVSRVVVEATTVVVGVLDVCLPPLLHDASARATTRRIPTLSRVFMARSSEGTS